MKRLSFILKKEREEKGEKRKRKEKEKKIPQIVK